jgi:hypothetical protein
VGVRGHEKDLAEVGKHAVHALWIAGCAEALAVLLLWWGISDPAASTEVRMGIGLALALLADLFTYALVRGL